MFTDLLQRLSLILEEEGWWATNMPRGPGCPAKYKHEGLNKCCIRQPFYAFEPRF